MGTMVGALLGRAADQEVRAGDFTTSPAGMVSVADASLLTFAGPGRGDSSATGSDS
jgi:hypothetical protein